MSKHKQLEEIIDRLKADIIYYSSPYTVDDNLYIQYNTKVEYAKELLELVLLLKK